MPRITVWAASLLSLFCLGASAPSTVDRQSPIASAPQLGQVNFPTSCAAEAQPSLETGVALLHSFQYQQADQSFSEAAKRDPKCALAYWGKAMTHYEQLWEFPSQKALKQGAQDIEHAQAAGASSERERGYIAAAAAFYLADEKFSETQRVQAFSAALAGLHKQFPDDVNAAALYALSLLALAEQQEVDAQPNRKAAIAMLEPLCRNAPDNPGPAHYMIHATDTSEFAAQGLDAARAYSTPCTCPHTFSSAWVCGKSPSLLISPPPPRPPKPPRSIAASPITSSTHSTF